MEFVYHQQKRFFRTKINVFRPFAPAPATHSDAPALKSTGLRKLTSGQAELEYSLGAQDFLQMRNA